MSLERALAAVVGLLLLSLAASRARRSAEYCGTPVDVLTVFTALWGGVLVLFAVPLLDYTTTPVVAWVATYGAIASGILACLVVERRRVAPMPVVAARRELHERIHRGRLRLVWAASALLGLLGLCAFVYAVSRVLPASAVITDPGAVRMVRRDSAVFQESYGAVKLLTYFNQVAFVLWTIGLRVGAFRDRWRWAAFAGAASVLPFVLTADRGLLVATVVWAGMLQLFWPQHLDLRRAVTAIAVAVLAAGIAVTVIGNRYGGSIEEHPGVARALTLDAARPLAIPYLYLTANIPTFGQLTQDHLAPLNAGGMTLLPFVKLADRAGMPGVPPEGNGAFYAIPFDDFSNYGWLGTFWLDFRLPGALLLPALVLGLAALLERRLRTRPTLGGLWLLSVLGYVVIFSPFANALSATLTWQFLLLTPLVVGLLDRDAGHRLRRAATRVSPRARAALASATLACAAAATVTAVLLRPSSQPEPPGLAAPEPILRTLAATAQTTFRQDQGYPTPIGLATRLAVHRPELQFDWQHSYTEPLPADGTIVVLSTPAAFILRSIGVDGRVYEVVRRESLRTTFGPGTRDE